MTVTSTSHGIPAAAAGTLTPGGDLALEHSPAMLVIPGTSSVEHLEENVAAAEIRLSQNPPFLARFSPINHVYPGLPLGCHTHMVGS